MRSARLIIGPIMMSWGLSLTLPALAAGGGSAGPAEGISYIPIAPPVVVNYGGPGKSRYIKAELSIRSENAADTTTVTHHLPLIRDRLVTILSAQNDAIVSTQEGKEYLRKHALAEINKALLQVQGLPVPATSPNPAPAVTAATPPTTTPSTTTPSSTAPATAEAQLPEVMPIAGPASDLYFNNFVVQK